jgi:hypothetical protein
MGMSSFKFAIKSILKLSLYLFLSGCTNYKIPTASFFDDSQTKCSALAHPLYQAVPRHRSQIKWYDLSHWAGWMILGNDDDGIFGEEETALYRLDELPTTWKAVKWACRNPMHNFCFYVIGSAHRVNSEFALLKCNCNKLCICTYRSSPEPDFELGPSFFLGFHGWKPCFYLHLYYNARYRGQFYIGWRERGNFGIKFLPFTKRKPVDKKNCNGQKVVPPDGYSENLSQQRSSELRKTLKLFAPGS